MAPAGRITGDYDPDPPGSRASAVLLIVTPAEELVFIRRSDDGRAHGGQMAFPGGMTEEYDRDLRATALRETEEEIGLSRGDMRVVGALSPLFIPVTNFTVWPYVALVDRVPEFTCQPGEVDDVVLVAIGDFDGSRAEMDWVRNGRTIKVPTFRFGNLDIWGATAMITAEFLAVWSDAT